MDLVPLLDLHRQNRPLRAAFQEAYDRVMDSGQFILGNEVQALETEIAGYCQAKHAIGVSSGTDALLLAMMVEGLGPGDEVLCPAFTFFGTAGSIARTGATPVWVDVLPDTFNIDLGDALPKVNDRTKAIVPVHLFGQSADMSCVEAFAKRFGLWILEDLAQSLGADYEGRPVGSMGRYGAISFYPTKNLGGCGDGGMLLVNDDEFAEKARWCRNHGMNPKYHHHYIGGNFRLDGLQAALLRAKLPHLEGYHTAREANAEFYNRELQGHGLLDLPKVRKRTRHVWNQYTLRVRDGQRDALRDHLAANKVGSEIYYPISLDEQTCFAGMGVGGDSVKTSRELAKSVLSIPVFPELTESERQRVVDVLWKFGY